MKKKIIDLVLKCLQKRLSTKEKYSGYSTGRFLDELEDGLDKIFSENSANSAE